MVCYAAQYNLPESAEGNSGAIPSCVTASAGFFIGDIPMKILRGKRWRQKYRKHQKKIYEESLSQHHDSLTSQQRSSVRIQLFIAQDGCCAICGLTEKENKIQ